MPVFPSTSVNYQGRTHTQLVVSEGNAPAEKYLPATSEAVKFEYQFGPEGNRGVVIPKGKIVSFAGCEYDIDTEKKIPTVKICDANDIPMGVNHHNVYERIRDRFSGNAPTILTREYIRVPLFKGADAAAGIALAAGIKFGAMSTAEVDPNNIYGKYVKSDANGNFVIADPVTTPGDIPLIVGQVYGIETDLPPAGFLQYFMEWTDNEYLDFIKQTQIVPSPGRTTANANTDDIATYPIGTGYFKTSEDLALALKNFRAGIPFLTDGYFKARTAVTMNLATDYVANGQILSVKATSAVAVAEDKTITVADPVGSAIFIRLRDPLCKDALPMATPDNTGKADAANYPEFAGQTPAAITVKVGATAETAVSVSSANLHVDYENNMLVIYFTSAVDAGSNIYITATVLQNQIPGIPTGWDFKGSVGEARILLMK